MRNLHELDRYRMTQEQANAWHGWRGDHTAGAFLVPSPVDKAQMVVVAAAAEGWDHVSVSRKNRCPNWTEMEHVARLFFADDETAMQLHVPPGDHVNRHPFVLHWWRSHDQPIPRPPQIFV